MPEPDAAHRSDLLTQMAALALAIACAAFAGYKVMKLNGLENPPADMGLNFPSPRRRVITDDSILVDDLTTGSISSPAPTGSGPERRPLQPDTGEPALQDYRLLQVINGLAFVEIRTLRGTEVRFLSAGSHLPGVGPVRRIARTDGRWTLVAGEATLVQQPWVARVPAELIEGQPVLP